MPDIEYFQAVLRDRMEAVGARDLRELVLIEAVHSGTPQPEYVDWDPTVVNAGNTLIDDEEEADDGANPLQLRWI
jgi:hypothetical protein